MKTLFLTAGLAAILGGSAWAQDIDGMPKRTALAYTDDNATLDPLSQIADALILRVQKTLKL